MNYTQYLQDGGELELPQVERGLGEQEVKALVLAIIENGDEQAADTLIELLKLDPENGWITDWIVGAKEAAEAGDENAQKFWSLIGPRLEALQQTEQFKCGGKVRAKVKKARCGKKMEKGAKVPVEKKGGCPCQYRRVGGRLQLVDCNGVPVAKNGTILYAKPGDQLPSALTNDAVKNYMTARQYSIGEVMDAIGNTIPAYRLWNKYYPNFVNRMNNWQQRLLESNPDFWGTPVSVKKAPTSQLQELHRLLTAEEIAALQAASRLGVEEYYKTPEGKAADERAKAAVAARVAAITQTDFGAGKQGTFGGLTYDLALARQKEMQAAKDQGFIVDLGRWGADGKWGSQSRGEWERYQKWKADQELAAMKAKNAELQRLESTAALTPTKITVDNSTASAPLAVTRNGDIVKTSSLTTGQALSQLNTPAWEEYTRRLRLGILSSKSGGTLKAQYGASLNPYLPIRATDRKSPEELGKEINAIFSVKRPETPVKKETPVDAITWNKLKLDTDSVRWIQEHLNALGFNAGEVDGKIGKNTVNAIKDFLKSLGLIADGKFGINTRQAFEEIVLGGRYNKNKWTAWTDSEGTHIGQELPDELVGLAALKALNSNLALLKPEVKGLVVETIRPNIKLSKFGSKLNYSKYLQ